MFFSEVAKDLKKLLVSKDDEIIKSEVHTGSTQEVVEEAEVEEPKEEEKKTAAPAMTPAQMQAAVLKKMAAAKGKKGAAGKGGAKGGKAAAPVKKPVVKKEEPKPEEEYIDKETRKKMDIEQMLGFCDEVQAIKARQVQTVWEILRIVNQIKEVNILNYQDVTLKAVIRPALRLLNYTCTRFSTFYFLQNLFMENRATPFYGIRVPLMGCLLCI